MIKNGNEEDIYFHHKSFRCKCNGIDVNQGYDINNPTIVITCFGNGLPLSLVLKFFKLGMSTFRNRNNDTLITLNKNGEKQKKKIKKRID